MRIRVATRAGPGHRHCPQTARAALPRNRDDRRPARSGRLPTPRSTPTVVRHTRLDEHEIR